MTVGIIATLKIQEGKEAEFESIFRDLASKVCANEPGNKLYQVFKARSGGGTYVVMEMYDSPEAVEAHRKSEHFRAAGPKIGPCLAGQPDIQLMDSI